MCLLYLSDAGGGGRQCTDIAFEFCLGFIRCYKVIAGGVCVICRSLHQFRVGQRASDGGQFLALGVQGFVRLAQQVSMRVGLLPQALYLKLQVGVIFLLLS